MPKVLLKLNLLNNLASLLKLLIELFQNIQPDFFLIFPVGIGLKQVLLINASRSDSYHIFNAPAAPEPIATASKEISEDENSTLVGAIKSPTIHVNKTRDITLGFIKLKND
jgi:hypothetical protein